MTAGAAGTLLWAVPLLAMTGGIAGYVRALGSQAGEDFAWVDMVWTNPTPRLLALALYRTFAVSWGDPRLGILVTLLAAAGFLPRDVSSLLSDEPVLGEVLDLLQNDSVPAEYRDNIRQVLRLLELEAGIRV